MASCGKYLVRPRAERRGWEWAPAKACSQRGSHLQILKHARMEALRGKSLDQQTQSLRDQVQITKQKVEGSQHELTDIAAQITPPATQCKTRSKELADTKDELQQLEAQRAMAAHAAAQQAKVHDPANTVDQLKKLRESAVAEEDEAMAIVGRGNRDKHALGEVANTMEQNKGEEEKICRLFDTIKQVTFNGSCWPTFEQFVESQWVNDVTLICAQEHRLCDGGIIAQKAQWRQRRGWPAHIPPASFNDSGERVNGVAILVRDGLDPGLSVCLEAPGLPKVGLMSTHFLASEGLGKTNLGLLADIAVPQADTNQLEHLMAGLQDSPEEFAPVECLKQLLATAVQLVAYTKRESAAGLQWAVLYFAALRCGVILSTLNPAYREDELGHQIADCGAAFLATVPELLGIAKTGAARCDTIREFFVFGEAPGATPFAELSRIGAYWEFQPVQIDKQNDVAVLPYSSGTTGMPKGVQLTHHNLVANIKQMSECIFPNIGKKDTFLAVLPFFHIYGMNKVLAMGLRSGVRIVTMPKFQAKEYLQLLKKYDVTVAHVAPPLVNFLANNPLVKEVLPLTSLKELFCGAAPLGYELALKAKKRLGIPIVRQGYGMTELSPSSHASPYDSHKYGSCGRLLANMECKIVDVDTGKTRGVGPTEAGELWLRGPNIMKGYLNHPDADKTIIDAQGFLHTGDIGYVDEDGDYFIIDRLKELIKVKGFQVSADLEPQM
ncbi:unnamed protein product [Prorocentrum cordatum]|uniref:AMP-dependent synthetase/ligase domain-containing protein n=1 Tax=Prorocentrum cordatum TaxID=2364126 RepID=A0ABN9U035_9DINO|nr:unnamed protein product [Polarella glacialis]